MTQLESDHSTIPSVPGMTRSGAWALLSLAISAFAIGTTEFMTNGLLLTLADDFHVSVAQAGLLTTCYAAGVVVGGPFLAAVTLRAPRKRLLIALMIVFVAGNIACACAPSLVVLMAGRFLTAFSHGAFFGVASVVASRLVPARKRASAIAIVFTGLTIANVLGMPIGAFIGQHVGWRESFGLVVMLGLIGLAGIAVLVPVDAQRPTQTLRGELVAFRSPAIWVALITTVIGFGGLFASFTYISPLLTHVSGFAPSSLTWLLAIYGVGLVVGNWVGGRIAPTYPRGTIATLLVVLVVALAAQGAFAASPVASVVLLFVVGGAGFGLVPPLQNRVIGLAPNSATMVSTANIAAFNLGATIGSLVGAAAVEQTGEYTVPSYAGAVMSLVGLMLFAVTVVGERARGTHGPRV